MTQNLIFFVTKIMFLRNAEPRSGEKWSYFAKINMRIKNFFPISPDFFLLTSKFPKIFFNFQFWRFALWFKLFRLYYAFFFGCASQEEDCMWLAENMSSRFKVFQGVKIFIITLKSISKCHLLPPEHKLFLNRIILFVTSKVFQGATLGEKGSIW